MTIIGATIRNIHTGELGTIVGIEQVPYHPTPDREIESGTDKTTASVFITSTFGPLHEEDYARHWTTYLDITEGTPLFVVQNKHTVAKNLAGKIGIVQRLNPGKNVVDLRFGTEEEGFTYHTLICWTDARPLIL